jgi:methyl-accepting chemotaxis protein
MERVGDMVESIANSSREHSRGTDMISAAVERMKDLTTHVRTSTREQSRASSLIARSTEDVTSMAERIREACQSQVDSSTLISKSVNSIEVATAANSRATKVMNASVADLTIQIDLLEKEMTGFKL